MSTPSVADPGPAGAARTDPYHFVFQLLEAGP